MTTSQEVFKKRREGHLDEAYQMAMQRMSAPDRDEWDDKALGWCLVDLIKRDANAAQNQNLPHYRKQLEVIDVPVSDEPLTKQRRFALTLCNPNGHLVNEARSLSKEGRHLEAANLYRKLVAGDPDDQNLHMSLGWELYRIAKAKLGENPLEISTIKSLLNQYLKLNVERPSILHSCILLVATRIAADEKMNMMAFCRIWGLENLLDKDWERFVSNDGKVSLSLAEKAIQKACKEAAKVNDQSAISYIFPFLDKAVSKYPDNVWLSLNKAKLLMALDKKDDALSFATDVAKEKYGEYWCWELLGDICADAEDNVSMSCYCKALLCSDDEMFLGKVRMKLACLLAERGNFPEAKHEVERVIQSKTKQGFKVPVQAANFAAQPWYVDAQSSISNKELYLSHQEQAEGVLFKNLPWIRANLGDAFTIQGKSGNSRMMRKLYIKSQTDPFEVVVPEARVMSISGDVGDPISIKGERDAQGKFQVFLVSHREDGESFDAFSDHVGIVDHVNHEKKLIHYIVRKGVDGVIPFSGFDGDFQVGDPISLKVASYSVKGERRYRAVSPAKANVEPPSFLKKSFEEEVSVSGDLGFTSSNIFVPPPLVKASGLKDGDIIAGVALLSYNKKRREWSWKAMLVNKA